MRPLKLILFPLLTAFLLQSVLPARAQDTNGAELVWSVALPEYGGESTCAVAPDGTIYQAGFRGEFFAITSGGKVKWKFQAGREIKSSPAVGTDGTIYFGSRDRKFYALAADGTLKWTFATGSWVDSSPAIAADGTIYFGSWDTNFYALTPDGKLKWKFATGSLIDSSPAIAADGTIYFGSHDNNLYALTPDGKLKWKFTTGAPIISSPSIAADGTVYFTSTDGNFYALKADGTPRWQLHTGDYWGSSPVLDVDGNIFVAVNNGHFSISSAGKIRWQRTTDWYVPGSLAAAANGLIYAPEPWRKIGTYTAESNPSSDIWHPWVYIFSYNIEGPNIDSSLNISADGTILGCDGHVLYAIKPVANAAPPAKSSWPVWRANPQHSGRIGN